MLSSSRQSFVKKYENLPIAKKLTLSFGIIIVCILVIALVNYIASKQIDRIDRHIKDDLLPIELAELGLKNHINDSLAQLRGYMILGKVKFKEDRKSAWKGIESKMGLINSKINQLDGETQALVTELDGILNKFSIAQGKVEFIANTIEEKPATKILLEQAAPKASLILAAVTNIINEEKTLAATPERKALLALLADSRGSFAVGLASIRAYLLTGDNAWKEDFLKRWDVNEARFKSLNENLYLFNAKQREAFSQYSSNRLQFAPLPKEMFSIRESAKWNMANYLLATEVAPRAEVALQISDKITQKIQSLITENINKLETYKLYAMFLTGLLTLVAIALAIIAVKFTTSRIVGPIDRLKASLNSIATGDLNHQVISTTNDEVGQALVTLESMRTQLHDMIEVDVKSLINSARVGDLSKRIDIKNKQGAYIDLCEGVNELLAVNDQIINETVAVFSALAHGDLSKRISADYQGDFYRIKEDANFTIDKLHQVIEQDIQSVINLAVAGDFSKRIETADKQGFFLSLSEKVNTFIDSNQAIVGDIARVLGAMSQGNLNESINTHYQGEFAKLKDDANNTQQRLKTIIEQEIQSVVDAALGGNLEKRIDETDKQGFFRDITVSINQLSEICYSIVADTSDSIAAISKGDLTKKIDHDYHGMFGNLKDSINTTIDQLKSTIDEIYESSEMVNSGSSEIAMGVDDLSSRTEQQASSLEETAASMEEMTSSVEQSSANAKEAAEMTAIAEQCAIAGGIAVDSAVNAMKGINDSSNKIAAIIGVIDEIAFQTNLLALNAAVEAARAGEQGRGFAVVAGEVRTLAQRSASAAKEIKDLISDSVERVENGSKLVNDSGETLKEIIESVKKVGLSIGSLSTASEQQYTGIQQVNTAVLSMDQMTQQNAALVEQSSAACQGLSDQAQRLSNLLSFFNTGKVTTHPPVTERLIPQKDKVISTPVAFESEPIAVIKEDNIKMDATQAREPISHTAHDVIDMDGEWEEF